MAGARQVPGLQGLLLSRELGLAGRLNMRNGQEQNDTLAHLEDLPVVEPSIGVEDALQGPHLQAAAHGVVSHHMGPDHLLEGHQPHHQDRHQYRGVTQFWTNPQMQNPQT